MRRGLVAVMAVCAVALLAGCASQSKHEGVGLDRDLGLPGEAGFTVTPDGAWSGFGGPTALYHEGEHRRTYVTWVNSIGDLRVLSFDHDTGERVKKTLRAEYQADDRAVPALLMRSDDRLAIFMSGFRGRWLLYRTASRREDISVWGAESDVGPHAGGSLGYSYAAPVQLSDEGDRLYVFWRGVGFATYFRVSDDRVKWTEPARFIHEEGAHPHVKVTSDGVSRIHFAMTSGLADDPGGGGIYYARYESGSVVRADGTDIADMDALPFAPSACDRVYDASTTGVPARVWDVADGADGNPVIVYATFPSDEDHVYWYARWNGVAWENRELTHAGGWFASGRPGSRNMDVHLSGGIALDHSDPSIVYLSREIDGIFEIERWVTPDRGETWNVDAITSNSRWNNVQPVVPENHGPDGPGLLWMNGPYSDHVEFLTSLRMK